MATYRVTSAAGQDMGTYEADSADGALDAMARDAGYESQAAAVAAGRRLVATIRYEACDVPVSDERRMVPGLRVHVTIPGHGERSGKVIPPEGDSIDCWAGYDLGTWIASASDEVRDALHDLAWRTTGAGVIEVEVLVADAVRQVMSGERAPWSERTHMIVDVPEGPIDVISVEMDDGDGLVLYTREEWEAETKADWEQAPDGTILFQGRPTFGRLVPVAS